MERRAEVGPVMYLVIGVILILVLVGFVIVLRGKSMGALDFIRAVLGGG